ncbi:MAG: hypothetical protein N4A72_15860 [Bacteroidales bacterium]|jgi:hypothetical protein|nr:hypothetical protein [Bacteroidales bacterium]
MRIIIYISGILGTLLLVLWTIVTVLELPLNRVFFISGLALLLLIFIPLVIIDRYLQNRKINKTIDSYKKADKKTTQQKKGESASKGWGMNNSPFRERRSGLTWGGGNIKGANATRGTRRSFLK